MGLISRTLIVAALLGGVLVSFLSSLTTSAAPGPKVLPETYISQITVK